MTNDQQQARIIRERLEESAATKARAVEECSQSIEAAAGLMTESLRSGGRILLCGNGGSAADCQHIAAEFTSVLTQEFMRPALSAIALTTDTSFLTANANDFGFEGVFARHVEALGRAGDVLVGISTSGNSKNVLRAVSRAKELGMRTIALTGRGGELPRTADVAIRVPSDRTSHIQETHIAIGHILCELVEMNLFPGRASQ
jgi:D-sedoheptulose 7-phosphate isomerase